MSVLALVLGLLIIQLVQARTVLLSSIPLPGHAAPLLSMGEALSLRGWTVAYASCSPFQHAFDSNKQMYEHVKFLPIGDCPAMANFSSVALEAAASHDYLVSLQLLQRWTLAMAPALYENTIKAVKQSGLTVDLLIFDSASYYGPDLASALSVPFIVNNADLVSSLSLTAVPPADSVPAMNTFITLNQWANQPAQHIFWRSILPLIRIYLTLYIRFSPSSPQALLNQYRTQVGLSEPADMLDQFRGHLILVNNGYGLEYLRTLPPNVYLTGPVLDMNKPISQYNEQMGQQDREWIQSSEQPIVYVSAGTIVPMSADIIERFLSAFTGGGFRVLWKLDSKDRQAVGAALEKVNSANIRVVNWVDSQLAILADERVKVFISHCGINSVYESAWLGTAIICVPIFADQADMGMRVADANIGFTLDKATFTSDELRGRISTLLSRSLDFDRELMRVRAMLAIHGGLAQAVQLIEIVAKYGVDALVPPEYSYPWYISYNLDVYFIWFISLFFMKKLFACCTRPARQCSSGRKGKGQKQE